jgi:hypothetical protein
MIYCNQDLAVKMNRLSSSTHGTGATSSALRAAGSFETVASFGCYGCEREYYGDPPMLTVRYSGAELRFCSDNCALDEGFAVAVEARYEAEIAGEELEFVWLDKRYERNRSIP